MEREGPKGRVLGMIDRIWVPCSLSVLVVAGAMTVFYLGPTTLQESAVESMILLSIVVALYIYSGTSGILQFGHIAFVAVGAYTAVYLTIPPATKQSLFPEFPPGLSWLLEVELAVLPATIIAGLIATAFALVLSPPLMRLGGVQAAIATLAVLVIVNVVLVQTSTVTRGTNPVYGAPQATTIWVAAAWATAVMFVAYAYQQSRHGLLLRATREDLRAAASSGVRVARERGRAFLLSAFFLGVAGSLYTHFLTSFSPAFFFVELTFLTVAMLVIGGSQSLSGAVAGVAFVSIVREASRRFEVAGVGPIPGGALPGVTEVVLAIILIVTLVLRPAGIAAGKEIPRLGWGGRRAVRAALATVGRGSWRQR